MKSIRQASLLPLACGEKVCEWQWRTMKTRSDATRIILKHEGYTFALILDLITDASSLALYTAPSM